jgi:hypothetical protein
MRERRVLWVVLAAFVVGLVATAGLAAVDDDTSGPPRLPALAAVTNEAAGAAPMADSSLRIAPVEYRVSGTLPALADHASAWRVGGEVDLEDARRLAGTLAIGGDPKEDETGWTFSADDRVLRIERAVAGGPWNLMPGSTCPDAAVSSDGTVQGGCAVAGSAGSASGSASGAATATEPAPPSTVACDMPDCPPGTACAQVCPSPEPVPAPMPVEPERPADLPSKVEAERIGRTWLDKAGLDVDRAEVRVEDGFSQWMVVADPIVGGLPTQGFSWSVGVGPKGQIQFANGWLVEPTEGDDYPLAGVTTGIERLKNGGGWSPYPGAPEPAIARDTGAPVEDVAPQVRTITGVRLGRMFSPVYSNDGASSEGVLVPAYLFAFDDTEYEQPVIAVADEFLPKPPEVEPQPEPMPVEPGGGTGAHGGSCSGSAEAAAPGQDNAPLTMDVCVDPLPAAAGQPVTFTVTASDPDAPVVEGQCEAGIKAVFGDEDATSSCTTSCAAPAATEHRKEPGKLATRYTHTYAEPGTYTAVFTARSGRDCDDNPYASPGKVVVEVAVER